MIWEKQRKTPYLQKWFEKNTKEDAHRNFCHPSSEWKTNKDMLIITKSATSIAEQRLDGREKVDLMQWRTSEFAYTLDSIS